MHVACTPAADLREFCKALVKISIIIPVYNTASYLERCMNSVLGQTHADLEVILVDDGSSDASPEICDEYAARDKRVRVIHQTNSGASVARNTGLKAATAELIGFVDSDDWLELDMYEYLLKYLAEYDADVAEIMLSMTGGEEKTLLQEPEKLTILNSNEILYHYFEHNEFGVYLRLYKKALFADVSFDVGRMNEDVVAGFLALQNSKRMVVSNQRKYHYFYNAAGVTLSPLSRRDLDLLYSGERLDGLTSDTPDTRLRKLALLKKYRGSFTLLVKMALYGCKEDIDEPSLKKSLQKECRKHYRALMGSKMPLNRKVLLTACCLSYPLVKGAATLYRKITTS